VTDSSGCVGQTGPAVVREPIRSASFKADLVGDSAAPGPTVPTSSAAAAAALLRVDRKDAAASRAALLPARQNVSVGSWGHGDANTSHCPASPPRLVLGLVPSCPAKCKERMLACKEPVRCPAAWVGPFTEHASPGDWHDAGKVQPISCACRDVRGAERPTGRPQEPSADSACWLRTSRWPRSAADGPAAGTADASDPRRPAEPGLRRRMGLKRCAATFLRQWRRAS
jgi:hypothetical protein